MSLLRTETGGRQMITDNDDRSLRCRRLGHEVRFEYCRTQEKSNLCPRILDCWWESFDVAEFLRRNLGQAALRQLSGGVAQPKMVSIVELAAQAKARGPATRDDPGTLPAAAHGSNCP